LRKEKEILESAQVPDFEPPLWEELGVQKIWPMALTVPHFMKYIPDEWEGGLRADRKFFWGILMFLNQDFTLGLVQDCEQQRKDRKSKASLGPNLTEIHPMFLQ
jgi:hypothetical protein